MKKITVLTFAVIMLLFCASTVHAQNQSAENSNVIGDHLWFEFYGSWNCPEYGLIEFAGEVQYIMKSLPNGTGIFHCNSYGEGYDKNGDLWKWHDAWKATWDGTSEVRNFVIQGPKGAKLKMRVLFVLNGKGEIVQDIFDPMCD